MNKRDRNFRSGSRGEDVTPDLEESEWKCRFNYASIWRNETLSERRNCSTKARKDVREMGEEDTPENHECELNDCEGDGSGKSVQNRFGRRIGQGGAQIPDDTKYLRQNVSTIHRHRKMVWYREFVL